MIEISGMKPEDAKNLAALDKICFSVPWSERSFAEEAQRDNSIYFVASASGEPVGYCGFWKIIDEGHITNVAVAPAYRRNGIARRLISEMLKSAEVLKLEMLTLEVREGNTAAISLYEGFGFQKIGKRKNYYTEPSEDALIMTLYLMD